MAWGKKKNPGYSYFAVGATLEGRLCFTGIIRLDGRVNGEIVSSGTLVVEETAVITGSVLVESIILSGTVHGSITAFKQVQLNASAKVYGHISYGELSIEGALHEGSSHKLSAEEIEDVQRQCQEIMEEAAAKAERGPSDQGNLAQFAAGLDAPEKPSGGPPDKKTVSVKKSPLPPGKGNPAPAVKTGENTSPALSAKPGEASAPPMPSKPGAEEASTGKGGGWISVKAGGPVSAKGGGAPPPAKSASPAGKSSS